jgi:hypothetical protein
LACVSHNLNILSKNWIEIQLFDSDQKKNVRPMLGLIFVMISVGGAFLASFVLPAIGLRLNYAAAVSSLVQDKVGSVNCSSGTL